MEHLPIGIIGNILSLLGAARAGIRASTTCKKWREAWQNHMHSLSFNCIDRGVSYSAFKKWDEFVEADENVPEGTLPSNLLSYYQKFLSSELEIIITETIFQTTGLQCLSICIQDNDVEFSAASVISWLIYTRGTLRRLCFDVKTTKRINILEICGRQLEELALSYHSIPCLNNDLNCPALRSISLTSVSISALDLSILLANCPKLQALCLMYMSIDHSGMSTMKLTSASLKDFFAHQLKFDHEFVLEADSIENLHLKYCTLEFFELVGKGSLRVLQIDDSRVKNLNIVGKGSLRVLQMDNSRVENIDIVGEGSLRVLQIANCRVKNLDIGESTSNLEVVDIRNITIGWLKFSHMISRSSNVRKLCLWGVNFKDEYSAANLEAIFICLPQLSQLSLGPHALRCASHWYSFPRLGQLPLRDNVLHCSSYLQNVTVLELSWAENTDQFSGWVVGVSERCPRLKKLVICRPRRTKKAASDLLASIDRLVSKDILIDVKYI